MDIRLYNTLSRSVETFTPLIPGRVGMYHCGPTVYDTPHIGNYRTFVMNDIVRRTFEYNDYEVDQVMNITDVDDKTIRRSHEENVALETVTRKYEKLFLEEIGSLHILRPTHLLRATDNIAFMIKMISGLLERGMAYKAADGIYMSVAKVKDYGALADIRPESIGKERIANDEYDKENPRDFSLWKFKTADDGEVGWDAPFGQGRPGWHIECSAMSIAKLGETFDVHTGGTDLIFPHHTNEIAQSESFTGKPFVHYWIHGAFMNVNSEKMAKSKKNFFKLSDIVEEKISPIGFRYWLLTAHYRSPVNFTFEAVSAAQNALIRLMDIVRKLPEDGDIDAVYRDRFLAAINEDLNVPQALAIAWEMVRDETIKPGDKRATLLDFDRVFGLGLADVPRATSRTIPAEVQALAEAREEARQAKEWEKADALRHEIEDRGFVVRDTKEAPGFILE